MKAIRTSLLLGLLVLVSGLTQAAPLGTAFTYQGRLDQNGQPATGLYQMTFWLYPASSGGSPIASNAIPNVGVTSGLFATDVDFGPSLFAGDERWLAITVATNGTSAFTLLQPRTRLAPTPNAIFASTAGNVTNGAIQVTQLGTIGAPTAGQVLGYNGTNLVWQAPGGGGGTWSLNPSNGSVFYNNGRVGIGTNQPSGALHVANGGVAVTGASSPFTGAGKGVFIEKVTLGGGLFKGALFAFDYDAGQPLPLLLNSPGGNVGIGTLTPGYRLEVFSAVNDAIAGRSTANGGVGVFGRSTSGWGMYGLSDGNGVVGESSAGGTGVVGRSASGWGMYGLSSANNGVVGESSASGTGVVGRSATGTGVYGESLGGGYAGHFAGKTKVCTLEIYGGCDLAEPFPMKEECVEQGSVVIIDEEHPGRLKLSTRAYDTQVAGIVSGANSINPGIALKQEGALDQGQNIALTGRVYVKADASFGAIKPGDLLTTSDTPGHAMKVRDHSRAQGAILGKAMSALKEGTGLVLVLVTLQ